MVNHQQFADLVQEFISSPRGREKNPQAPRGEALASW